MLIKGDSISLNDEKQSDDMYESIFEKLFLKQSKRAMYLHKLATMEETHVIELFKLADTQLDPGKISSIEILDKLLVDELLVKYLEMDSDSIEWLKALTRVSMGDYEGFDYITKEYNITNTKASIYKAICSKDIFSMDSLFHAVDSEVPVELCKQVAMILNGDINELRDLIMYRVHLDTNKKSFDLTYDNVYKIPLPKSLENEKERFGENLKVLFSVVEGEGIDIDSLKKIVSLSEIDENLAYVLNGYNAIINKDFNHVVELFEYHEFRDQINNSPLVNAVLGLATNRWDKKSLKVIIENIIISNNLYTH